MKAPLTAALLFTLVGCAATPNLSHTFERQLVVGGPSVPHLSRSAWESIREQFAKRAGYEFKSARRESIDLVWVDLVPIGVRDPKSWISLCFELRDGRWIENAAREERVDLASANGGRTNA